MIRKTEYTARHVNDLPDIHPGEFLKKEFLDHSSENVYQFAKNTGININHLNSLLEGRSKITTEDAFRLARYLGTTIDVWLGLQEAYDVKCFERFGPLDHIWRKVKPRVAKTI